MSGWLDSLFGNLPPPPARPTSRGATFGAAYQDMPTSTNIEDRRPGGDTTNVFPSRPHDQMHRMMVNPFGQTYNIDQLDYLQKNMPQLAALKAPTTPLPDPANVPDQSIIAQKNAQDQWPPPPWRWKAYGGQFLDVPGTSLNSVPWGQGLQ